MTKELKFYCGCCGLPLKQIPYMHFFDIETGEPYHHWRWVCPKKRWYNTHSNFKTDKHGSGYSFYP